ncbi:hypothetical protein TWF225_007966 [Orbilia oligospora]|uniref:Uncharacterized protein n=1 Tax=Orbilia oligospora TaxID=2813651 RepID=A0A8H2HLI6_ORBOL|nr:hypothetical protein TWF225_007966 [Orbilia oligospora]KAF3232153.1 hypothetical protein TWF128_004456 [Orbilia oligospora]KAF3232154.1 hypothetical protein TWF128_004456 [Orbilia oligospora]KAF3279625.1 hypothetical protein TWF132_012040 [Orbilia oligospora]TGJ63618.1 hypothetical protein EYR41_011521 [Orbilia oligospora]
MCCCWCCCCSPRIQQHSSLVAMSNRYPPHSRFNGSGRLHELQLEPLSNPKTQSAPYKLKILSTSGISKYLLTYFPGK